MITTLVVSTLVCAIVWLVRYVREGRRIDRILRDFPYRIDPTPPTAAEITYDPRIPLDARTHAAKLGKRVIAGESPPRDTSALWYNGPLLEDVESAVPYDGPIKALMSPYEPGCSCPHAATHGHLGGCVHDTNPHYTVRRFATGGIVRGGQPVFLNEYADYRTASGARVITTTGVDPASIPPPVSLDPPAPTGCQHPNPEPVVLTTDEVVAGVCPDCLQPLPPSSVGSEWKP